MYERVRWKKLAYTESDTHHQITQNFFQATSAILIPSTVNLKTWILEINLAAFEDVLGNFRFDRQRSD